ncbi:hypothetical protein CBR_g37128 [Chara braunii]|uniref:Uncharacterized protein n=1 Tax=Chara braunii TaxID=69332 RepID=A0A388LMA1_CHABU|nr:hypothetical protein CBR_g37128 [Chara braunii]|eukprot:GBG83414.1 hypothetical protein CBR_g37128 [Chara braunii]
MTTPGTEGTGRSPPVAPQEERDYWEDEDRIRELMAMCSDDGIYPTDLDPGEMVVEGREARFRLNTSLDDIKVKWLKERTVTVIFKEAARFLPKNVKDDLVRAFEDGWVIGNENLTENSRRGRVKIEGPGVASYVAKAREVAAFMIAEGHVEITLGGETYRILFKPWMTRAEFRDLRRQEDKSTFWVIALQIPLDDMPFIYAQIEKAIGKIVLAHPADADPNRPPLVNARFDLDPEARQNMKDILWIETPKGDTLEVRLATAGTPKCRKCRQFFHTEDECRRGGSQRTRAVAGATSSNQRQNSHPGPAVSGQGGGQTPGGYQGTMGPCQETPAPSGAASHGGTTRLNPIFSPQGRNAVSMAHMGVPMMGNQAPMGGGPSLFTYGMPPAQGTDLQGNCWQGGAISSDWLMTSGFNPALWSGWAMGLQGSQGGLGAGGMGGQVGNPGFLQQQGASGVPTPGAAGSSAEGRNVNNPVPSGLGNSAGAGGEERERGSEGTPGRARGRPTDKDKHWTLLGERILSREWNLSRPTDVWACVWIDSFLRKKVKSEFWSAVLQAWRKVKPDVLCMPKTKEEVLSQIIFENPCVKDGNGRMLMADRAPGSFGRSWVERGVVRLRDMWDDITGTWCSDAVLQEMLKPSKFVRARKQQAIDALPAEWLGILSPLQDNPPGTWYSMQAQDSEQLFLKMVVAPTEGGVKFQQWRHEGRDGNLEVCEDGEELIRFPRGAVKEIRVREVVEREGCPWGNCSSR